MALAFLVWRGLRQIPHVVLAIILGECVINVDRLQGPSGFIATSIMATGICLTAYLLARQYRLEAALTSKRDVLRLIGVTQMGIFVIGLPYCWVLVAIDGVPSDQFLSSLKQFYIGYGAAILAWLPPWVMLQDAERRRQFLSFLRDWITWVQFAAALAILWWSWSVVDSANDHLHDVYLLFVPMAWAAIRFGMVGAVSQMLFVKGSIFVLLIMMSGGGEAGDHDAFRRFFEFQFFAIMLGVTGLLLGIAADEQRQVTAQLHESLRLAAAGEMAAALTHEINQPLTALVNYASVGQQLAARSPPNAERLQDIMGKISDEANRSASLVRRLRDFFRSGKTRLEWVDVAALAARAVTSQRARAASARVTLSSRSTPGIAPLLIDPVQIDLVLRNLIANAIESAAADKTGGTVDVAISQGATHEITVAVAASGGGVTATRATRMFDAHTSTKTSGMGLAISRATVNAHGRRVWVTPGGSGLLCFTLPIDAAQVMS